MRRALVLLLLLIALASPTGAHRVGSPAYVNFLLDHFTTPDLAPGDRGPFQFTFTNTYPWNMSGVSLRLEVYRYREIDVDLPVDAAWTHPGPDFFDENGVRQGLTYDPPMAGPNRTGVFRPGESERIAFTVVTYPDTVHGSITKQGSYFVRTRLEFDLSDGTTTNHSYMMSKGYFTDAQFDTARLPCSPAGSNGTCPSSIYYEGTLNMTYLGSVYNLPGGHLDGLLPESAFSVADQMPLWPYLVAGGATAASLVFAVLFYAEENPGKYPRLARWWLAVKGKARQARPPKST